MQQSMLPDESERGEKVMSTDEDLKKIAEMRQFLYYCSITGYMLDEQIAFLNRAVDALEREVKDEH